MAFCSCPADKHTGNLRVSAVSFVDDRARYFTLLERILAMKKIYVGNLPFSSSEDEVREVFEQHGTVHSVKLIMDRETGRPRGFGFVEMDESDADAAIEALNNTELGGRSLKVNEALERGARPRRF